MEKKITLKWNYRQIEVMNIELNLISKWLGISSYILMNLIIINFDNTLLLEIVLMEYPKNIYFRNAG